MAIGGVDPSRAMPSFDLRFLLLTSCTLALACDPRDPPPSPAGGTTTGDPHATGSGGVDPATSAIPGDSTGSITSSGPDTQTTGQDAGSDSGSSSGMGSDSDSGGESSSESTGGEDMPVPCDLPGCWQECSRVVDTMGGVEFGECYAATIDWTPAACATAPLCEPLDWWMAGSEPALFVERAQCLLDALATGTPGHVEYSVALDEYDVRTGTIFVVGDGTVLLDMTLGSHCGDGGSYGERPIKTRNLDVLAPDQEPLISCLAEQDAVALSDCVFGPFPDSAISPDVFPWLAGSCSMGPPTCP